MGKPQASQAPQKDAALYRAVWRWHFYAAVYVLPLMVVLALSGTLFLFKPQIERWEERAFHNLQNSGEVAPSAQVTAALAGNPGAKLAYYRLPERKGDAAAIHLAMPGGGMTDVFVSPQGDVLGSIDPESRIISIARDIHGQLLLGRRGSWLVELAASWAIVMVVTGLYLWWPRGRGMAGVIYPRLSQGKRAFWRDLHAVTGFWVAGLTLILLFTGLPWADVWGSAFKAVRTEMGWVAGPQDWTIGGQPASDAASGGHEGHEGHGGGQDANKQSMHAEHDHHAMHLAQSGGHAGHRVSGQNAVMLDRMVANGQAERLEFPVQVVPPGGRAGSGGDRSAAKGWVVKSDTQNRPNRVVLTYDAMSGKLISRDDFASRHPIDQVVGYGVAWHEGQLFGWINQLIGVLTALMLVTLCISGAMMWWRRKPEGGLGAPKAYSMPARPKGIVAWTLFAFLLLVLPMFLISLIAILLIERFILPHAPKAQRWLGVA
ncbi:PepSY domain-containing protein [Novosphingobium sp. ERN07]|uniref:PepSY-associated TM helix domain-containing protein n=1 Tax=Novosphingobium sp. ERN07 TaxID=2726187 RepID=UPI0014565D1F|nr:PepSY domain-containing protein [Novosphingobium sp. ERN07]NLR69882.1 PepSY domain-containing protein [Novosphingobium sp. ERN07]